VLLIALMVTDAYVGQWSWALYFALICSLGSVLGGIAGYAIGYYGGRPVLVRFVAPERITYVEQAFDRYGVWAVAVAGFTPVPYKVFTIAAGAFRFNVPRFVLASAVSRSLRFFAVASVMALLGVPGQQWLEANLVLFTVAVVLLLALAVFVLHRWAARRRRARAKALEAVYGTTSPGGQVQIEPDNEPGTQSSERRPSET
jgi:membrane protein YqaA with SNARE-associated domain